MNKNDAIWSKAEIISALEQLGREDLQYWLGFSSKQFIEPIGEAWSPANNVRHLNKSTKPVITALRLPRMLLRILFGSPKTASRTYLQLRSSYQEVLQRGGQAGRFAPSPTNPPVDIGAWQKDLVKRCQKSVEELVEVARSWEESDLDRYLLPHPLLGKLTIREMLFFTIYHYTHHQNNVERRLEGKRT
ncbi:MAG: DinB family protein [Blastocatellia bacterium]|nr:DinB family protein [Blastocatellia bacterium]